MDVKLGYKQTEVGVIPEDWTPLQIGDHVEIRSGESPSRFKMGSGDVPYFKVEQVGKGEGKIGPDGTPYFVTCAKPAEAGSIIFPKRGASILLNRVRVLEVPSFMDTNLMTLTADEHLDSRYLHLALLHFGLFRVADTTSIPQINNKHIRPLLLPAPTTISEQSAIASALSDVDGLLGALDRLIAKKRDLKQAAMQQLLTGQTRIPRFTGEWQRTTLGDVIDRCSSGATPYRGRSEYYKGTIKWISSGELNYNVIYDTIEHISKEAVRKTNLTVHPPGTFLMAITGLEAAGTRGACGIVGSPATTNQSCMAIYPTDKLITEYLFHHYVLRGNELAFNYCQGTKQQSYTAKLVKILPIDLPPTTEEQTAIAKILSGMDAELAALEQRRDKTRAIKQGMMQELLTGRTRLVNSDGSLKGEQACSTTA